MVYVMVVMMAVQYIHLKWIQLCINDTLYHSITYFVLIKNTNMHYNLFFAIIPLLKDIF